MVVGPGAAVASVIEVVVVAVSFIILYTLTGIFFHFLLSLDESHHVHISFACYQSKNVFFLYSCFFLVLNFHKGLLR